MPDDFVVKAVHTQTARFVSPEGEEFYYFSMECHFGNGLPNIKLLFNQPLSIGIASDILQMVKTAFGIIDMPQATDPQMALAFDQPIDWDNMPPPLTEADIERYTAPTYEGEDDNG